MLKYTISANVHWSIALNFRLLEKYWNTLNPILTKKAHTNHQEESRLHQCHRQHDKKQINIDTESAPFWCFYKRRSSKQHFNAEQRIKKAWIIPIIWIFKYYKKVSSQALIIYVAIFFAGFLFVSTGLAYNSFWTSGFVTSKQFHWKARSL